MLVTVSARLRGSYWSVSFHFSAPPGSREPAVGMHGFPGLAYRIPFRFDGGICTDITDELDIPSRDVVIVTVDHLKVGGVDSADQCH